jgi:hypothetical protein
MLLPTARAMASRVVGIGSWFEHSSDVVGPPAGDGGTTPLADRYVLAKVMRYWG